MPTYVYRFIDTGETIEIRQSFDDAPLTEAPHPSDGQPRPVKKVFTPVGITFKGSGFYKTDSGAGAKSSKSDGANAGGSSSGTSSATPSGAASATPSGTSAGDGSSGASNGTSTASGSSTGNSSGGSSN
jgi:predicted nucleic acid-binding Zn ribbon protein